MLAKMATRKAKPNGQYYLKSEEVLEFMSEQSVQNIPGNIIKPRSYTMVQWFTIIEKLNGHRQNFDNSKGHKLVIPSQRDCRQPTIDNNIKLPH